MKTIILEDGKKVNISDESYEALKKSVQKPVWKNVVGERMITKVSMNFFSGWCSDRFSWLYNEQSQKEFEIYLHMLLWKDTYDKDFVPDWENGDQKKWYIYYNHIEKHWTVDCWSKYQENMQVYVSSEEKAEQMLKDLESIGVL